jgi:paired amphipathic helix protein Sin3a
VSYPSEDSKFIRSKKNQYEELIFCIEDERFELDNLLETNMSTIRVLENITSKLSQMNSDEKSKFKLTNSLGGTSETIHLKSMQQAYGDKSKDFINGLKRTPAIVVPMVLKRLQAKDKEWREAKKLLDKQWHKQIERNYLKSLDHLAGSFKQNDQKHLKAKSLINEIKDAKQECQQASRSLVAAEQVIPVNIGSLLSDQSKLVSFFLNQYY